MIRVLIFFTATLFLSCGTSKKRESNQMNTTSSNLLPPVYVYKTKKNFSKLLPVTLSPDKKEIIGYPHPKDVVNDSSYNYPSKLFGDYWIDRIGINVNTGYLNITLKDYAELSEPLTPTQMMSILIEDSPFLEIWIPKKGVDVNVISINDMIIYGTMEDHLIRIK